jgi:ATP-dependent DNA ligase
MHAQHAKQPRGCRLRLWLHAQDSRTAVFASARCRPWRIAVRTGASTLPIVTEAPDSADWLSEIKFDGYRVIASINEGCVRLLTRRGLDWTARLPHVAAAFARLGCGSDDWPSSATYSLVA